MGFDLTLLEAMMNGAIRKWALASLAGLVLVPLWA